MNQPFVVVTLRGQPQGKGRPRFGRAGAFVRVWTDKKTASYEKLLGAAGHEAMAGLSALDTALSVVIEAAMGIPPSWPRKRRSAALSGDLSPIGRPDFDNIAKGICDALNGIVWRDDSQIVACTFRKFYSEYPGIKISVWEWDQ